LAAFGGVRQRRGVGGVSVVGEVARAVNDAL